MKLLVKLGFLFFMICLTSIKSEICKEKRSLGSFFRRHAAKNEIRNYWYGHNSEHCCRLWDPVLPVLNWGRWARKTRYCESYFWSRFMHCWLHYTYRCGTITFCDTQGETDSNCGQIFRPTTKTEKPITKKPREQKTKWSREFEVPVTSLLNASVFKSDRTGLTIAFGKTESPIVHGFFCLNTEAQTNQGLPHTLEHLIFMGSSGYPYKGLLNLLANRCLAGRPNAWTATDYTCYTVSTAGINGFLNILPIYLDHILHPTLKDGDYKTQVHRINGEGEDVGVVYGEMQGIENSPERILSMELFELLYPKDPGYSKETVGKLQSLRDETSIENVRNYHQKFYRPENLFLTITGPVDSEDIFDTLEKVEEKWIKEKGNIGTFKKPWQKNTRIPPSITKDWKYASEDETGGYVKIGWRKNSSITENIKDFHAQKFLLYYFTLPQVGPLDLQIVNTEDSIATSILVETENFKQPLLILSFANIPVKNLTHVAPKVESIFKAVYEEGDEAFNEKHLKSLHGLINNENLRIKKDLENIPQAFVPQVTNIYQLYGDGKEDFESLLTKELLSTNLKKESAHFWLEVLGRTLIEAPKAVVRGIPSKALQEANKLKETERIQARNEKLDHHKLKREENDAIANQIKPSKEIIEKVPLADVNDIIFQKIKTINRKMNPAKYFDFKDFPFEMNLIDVDSSFVEFYIIMNTRHLTSRQKQLLPVLLDIWLYSPLIYPNGNYVPLDEVLQKRDKNILGFYANFGIMGEYQEAVVFEAQCKLDNLDVALEDIHDALLFSQPDASDVEFFVIQKLDSVPETKQSPLVVEFAIFNSLVYDKESGIYLTGFLKQTPFLENLVVEDFNTTVSELKVIMNLITVSESSLVYVATNVSKLVGEHKKSYKKIANIFSEDLNQKKNITRFPNPALPRAEYQLKNKFIPQRHVAVGVSGTDSCYLKKTVDFSIRDWNHPEIAQVEVLLRYISDRMFDRVRGPGFTYGIKMSLSISKGLITLDISRSPQLVDAVIEVKNIFTEYSGGNRSVWETTLLDSTKGSIIFEKTMMEENVEDLVVEASKGFLRNTGAKYNRNLVQKLAGVSIDDLNSLSIKYLPKFFQQYNSLSILTCSPASIDVVVEEFSRVVGFDVPKYENIDAVAESQTR